MLVELKMPVLGLTMDSGIVVEWLKGEGDPVEVDDAVLVVETDKAAMDVPCPTAGILARIVVAPGDEVPVGEPVGYIAETAEDLALLTSSGQPAPSSAALPAESPRVATMAAPAEPPSPAGVGPSPPPGAGPGPRARVFASPRARRAAGQLGIDLDQVAFAGARITEADVLRLADADPQPDRPPEEIRLTPLARKLAAELGIDLADIEADPGMRIRASDLLAASARAEHSLAASPSDGRPGLERNPDFSTGDLQKLNRLRRVTAERMAANWVAPQVTFNCRVDMTKALALRSDLRGTADARGIRLTFDAMFVRAAATALLEFPQVNAQWVDGDSIRLCCEAHVGVAVDVGDGLIVPVVRNAHALGLLETAAEVGRLVELARTGRLGPDDYKGGTFTISNLGLFGIEAFTPIVNLPEAAILGIGSITPTPVYVEGELAERHLCTLSLTADHRLVDGVPAARFLQRVREQLELPVLLLERGL